MPQIGSQGINMENGIEKKTSYRISTGNGSPEAGCFHKWIEENRNHFTQFIKFSLVGVSNTLVSFAVNVTTLFLLRPYGIPVDYIIANIIAFALSVLWSYLLNSRFVFKPGEEGKRSGIRILVRTYVAYGFTGIFLNNILSTVWIRIFHIEKFVSPLLNIPFCVPVNFYLNKFWAYSDKGK